MEASKEQIFWKWFIHNKDKFDSLDNLPKNEAESVLNELILELKRYNQSLYFQISSNMEPELVISAEGNKEHFNDVEKLVNAAPKINGWKITAFKQPSGENVITEYEGLELNPKKMWFEPLDNEKKPSEIGLAVYVEQFDSKQRSKYLFGIWQVLDALLGEVSTANDIKHIEVHNLPLDPTKDGLTKMPELPKYVLWHKGVK